MEEQAEHLKTLSDLEMMSTSLENAIVYFLLSLLQRVKLLLEPQSLLKAEDESMVKKRSLPIPIDKTIHLHQASLAIPSIPLYQSSL